jgi:hypothetical protein
MKVARSIFGFKRDEVRGGWKTLYHEEFIIYTDLQMLLG